MIELLPGFRDDTVAAACSGHVSRSDYQSVLLPRVREALDSHDKLRLYYRVSSDFEGIEPSAVWEDMKIGLGHARHWERIAIVTDVAWIHHAMQLLGFLIAGELRWFSLAEEAAARTWIGE